MKTFRVRVIRELRYEVEVQAETPSAAENAACHAPIPPELNVATLGDLAVMGCETILQVGEPWVYGWSGYDPENSYYGRPDGYVNSGNELLVFQAPRGRAFTKSNVDLLLGRIEVLVGPVQKHWNGAGCGGFSVQMKEPYANLTPAQIAGLMAPRSHSLLQKDAASVRTSDALSVLRGSDSAVDLADCLGWVWDLGAWRIPLGEHFTSPDKKFDLVLQRDGNLVLYSNADREPLWCAFMDPVRGDHRVTHAVCEGGTGKGRLLLWGDDEVIFERRRPTKGRS